MRGKKGSVAPGTTLMVRNVPEDLHHAAKLAALSARQDLRQFVIDALRAAVAAKKEGSK